MRFRQLKREGRTIGTRSAGGSRLLRFLIVGALGFVVDSGVLMVLVRGAGLSPVWCRIPSFLVAVTVTWWVHRQFTFAIASHTRPSIREWTKFVLAHGVGNAANLAIYWGLLLLLEWPVMVALAIASVAAAGINYAMSARWVFRAPEA